MSIKACLKRALPGPLQRLGTRAAAGWRAFGRGPDAVFDDVYARGRWSETRAHGAVYSGSGSEPANSAAYEALVVRLVDALAAQRVLDIGIGDGRIAGRLLARLPDVERFIGVDVSRRAVDHVAATNTDPRLACRVCDATVDPLPEADIVLVREVMQHLSNALVARLVARLRDYPLVIATNSIHQSAERLNADLATGAADRAAIGSGLSLRATPFGVPAIEMLRTPHADMPYEIVSEVFGTELSAVQHRAGAPYSAA